MAGWFPENDDERRKRISQENAAKRDAEYQKKKQERRRQEKAAFQKKIDAEVEKRLDELNPDKKKARLEQMHGSSCLLNGALGLEFAAKGLKGGPAQTPWMSSPKISLDPRSNKTDANNEAKEASKQVERVPRLNRPY